MSDDETVSLIIDNGSYQSKVGIAGDDEPVAKVKNLVCHYEDDKKSKYVGYKTSAGEDLAPPLQHGFITNIESMEHLWSHIFTDKLHTDPKNQPVLLTEPVLNPRANREKMVHSMFETFEVPATYIALQPQLSIYASGRGSSLLMESGDSVTQIIPIYEGHAIRSGIRRVDFGGQHITNHLMQKLAERGYSFTTNTERELVRDMKEKLCFVAQNYNEESVTGSKEEQEFILPDGQIITLGPERFYSPETMFDPSISGITHCGLHQMFHSALMDCDIDTRPDLCANMCISGGNTLITGFAERMQTELSCLIPSNRKVRVIARPERDIWTWIGGSIIASLSIFQQWWITKADYDEFGPAIVHRKCY